MVFLRSPTAVDPGQAWAVASEDVGQLRPLFWHHCGTFFSGNRLSEKGSGEVQEMLLHLSVPEMIQAKAKIAIFF
ncbi:hypothetical protein, partial [Deinococcus hohokamensis]